VSVMSDIDLHLRQIACEATSQEEAMRDVAEELRRLGAEDPEWIERQVNSVIKRERGPNV